MIPCNDIQEDRFEIILFQAKQQYFKKNYLRSAQMINSLLIDTSKYKSIVSLKKDVLTYKRLIDFWIEEHYLKTKIILF